MTDTPCRVSEGIRHTQEVAWKLGHGQLAIEVHGWAIRNAMTIPNPALKELMDMITRDPKVPA